MPPKIEELLNDPLVKLMLHSDGVDRAALFMTLSRIRTHLLRRSGNDGAPRQLSA
jgi:hypothetical protein